MTHQFVVYGDGVNLLEVKINTVEINTEAVTTEKTKYIFMPRSRNAGQNDNRKISNGSLETVTHFKYLDTAVTDQNLIHGEIKSRLSFGNACYHKVQNLSSSRLLSRNIKIKICKTIILPVVLYGYETL
jgi:hypothetical protein